ncbi:hypothetical protein GLOIN_2v1597745, partial [Rhizophagus irregularis DAOM 181602=DAOM 197198]
ITGSLVRILLQTSRALNCGQHSVITDIVLSLTLHSGIRRVSICVQHRSRPTITFSVMVLQQINPNFFRFGQEFA